MPRLKRKRRLTEKFLLVILLRVSSLRKEKEERYFLYFECHLVKMGNPTLLWISDWNNIKPNSLGTHIHLAAWRGAKGPTFPLSWVYIKKYKFVNKYLHRYVNFLFFFLTSQLATCRCVDNINQFVSAACWKKLINNRYTTTHVCLSLTTESFSIELVTCLPLLFLEFFVFSSLPRYGELLVPYYNELAEAARSSGLLTFGHDHVGHGRSEGERVQVWSKVESQK